MRWVKWMIEETYPAPEASKCLIKKITDAMEKLFKYYKSELELRDYLESPQKKGKSASSSKEKEKRHSLMNDMFDDVEDSEVSEAGKAEIEYYLSGAHEDKKNPRFNILHWWRVTGSKYKVESMMARDSSACMQHRYRSADFVDMSIIMEAP